MAKDNKKEMVVREAGRTKKMDLGTIDIAALEKQAATLNMSLEDYCARLGVSKEKIFAAQMEGEELSVVNDQTGKTKNIILPKGWDKERGIFALQAAIDADKKEINFNRSYKCIPVDGMVALHKAMKRLMGFTSVAGNNSFFGEQPPIMVQIRTSLETSEQIPYCKILPPAWDGGYLQPKIANFDCLVIGGVVKQKFKDQVDAILNEVGSILKDESIYKNKPISIDFAWKTEGAGYNPELNAPEFMDVRNVKIDDLILNPEVELRLEHEVWNRITQPEACLENGLQLKTGLLLSGDFGTGKTLCARVTARLCEENGWTFIYLKTPKELVSTLNMAKNYSPCVVFCEDIDRVLSGERDDYINKVSVALDGLDSKTNPIITIVTSNNPAVINPVNIRPGRISSSIVLTPPKAGAAAKFVEVYAVNTSGQSLLDPSVDLLSVGELLAGYVPAFIREAVNRAVGSCIYKHGRDIVGKITTEDLILAAKSLTEHIELMKGRTKSDDEVFCDNVKGVISHLTKPGQFVGLDELMTKITEIRENV